MTYQQARISLRLTDRQGYFFAPFKLCDKRQLTEGSNKDWTALRKHIFPEGRTWGLWPYLTAGNKSSASCKYWDFRNPWNEEEFHRNDVPACHGAHNTLGHLIITESESILRSSVKDMPWLSVPIEGKGKHGILKECSNQSILTLNQLPHMFFFVVNRSGLNSRDRRVKFKTRHVPQSHSENGFNRETGKTLFLFLAFPLVWWSIKHFLW